MKETIWFDMDGTIADLYAVENWLPKLRAEDPSPYLEAGVMWNMSLLARLMNKVQQAGYEIGIISWTSKNGSKSYNEAVASAKMKWLKLHLASVNFNYIMIVDYGTPKATFMNTKYDILFDDEENNIANWDGKAFTPNYITLVLKELIDKR